MVAKIKQNGEIGRLGKGLTGSILVPSPSGGKREKGSEKTTALESRVQAPAMGEVIFVWGELGGKRRVAGGEESALRGQQGGKIKDGRIVTPNKTDLCLERFQHGAKGKKEVATEQQTTLFLKRRRKKEGAEGWQRN